MNAKRNLAGLLVVAGSVLAVPAHANDRVVGALLGAGAGAAIGAMIGGHDGAVVGSAIGAVTGAAVSHSRVVVAQPGVGVPAATPVHWGGHASPPVVVTPAPAYPGRAYPAPVYAPPVVVGRPVVVHPAPTVIYERGYGVRHPYGHRGFYEPRGRAYGFYDRHGRWHAYPPGYVHRH